MYRAEIVGRARRAGTVRAVAALALGVAGVLIFVPVLTEPTPGRWSDGGLSFGWPACRACLAEADAAAPAATSTDLYAAIAYSKSTGRTGIGYNFATRAGAEARAIQRCGVSDCTIKVWVRNGCCALAVGDRGAYGWSYRYRSDAYSEARARATNECNRRGTNCRIAAWACTNR